MGKIIITLIYTQDKLVQLKDISNMLFEDDCPPWLLLVLVYQSTQLI